MLDNCVFGFCFLYLPDLIIGVGFVTAMTFKTQLWNVDFIDFFVLWLFSYKCVINRTCNKQEYLLYIAYLLIALDAYMSMKGNRQAVNRQYITGNLSYNINVGFAFAYLGT